MRAFSAFSVKGCCGLRMPTLCKIDAKANERSQRGLPSARGDTQKVIEGFVVLWEYEEVDVIEGNRVRGGGRNEGSV